MSITLLPAPTQLALPSSFAGQPTAGSLAVVMTAGDNTNGNSFVGIDKQILLVQNTAGGSGTFGVTSTADNQGRFADITAYSVAGSGIAALYLPGDGFRQTDNSIQLTCSATTMKFGVLRLP